VDGLVIKANNKRAIHFPARQLFAALSHDPRGLNKKLNDQAHERAVDVPAVTIIGAEVQSNAYDHGLKRLAPKNGEDRHLRERHR
jgi:hypothetical protein